jgi:predicted SnoaL-like aldol condensation-catalyzing enzyme
MANSQEARNKLIVLEAFDTLFNQRDYAAAEKLWSPKYVQHTPHDPELGREALINLIKALPSSLKYEAETIVAYGDFVIVHGKFSGAGQPRNWIAADVVRIENGVLAEHWDASRAR